MYYEDQVVTLLRSGLHELNYSITNLTEGHYSFRVVAFNQFGNCSSNVINIEVDFPYKYNPSDDDMIVPTITIIVAIAIITFFLLVFFIYGSQEGESSQFARTPKPNNRHIPASIREKIWNRDAGRCVICGSTVDIEYDHMIPFSRGGSHSVNNIRILCKKCNRSRSNKIGDK